jgi:coatomer subunit beta'
LIRKIDVSPNEIIWSDNKKFVALLCDDITYILNAFPEKIDEYLENSPDLESEEGCNEAFEPYYEVNDKIVNGFFIDEVFVFVNSKNKLNYAIEEKIFSITTLNANFSLLGYLQSANKIFLMNKQFNLISYTFPLSFVNYQMAILKKEFELAEKVCFL